VYSPDPQVDKVDYYRQDTGLENFTYVGTGPNTNPPTPITDALTDLEASTNQQMTFTDYEPVPSIDLPRSGHCNVAGGIITTLDTPFDKRWLPGTVILIGSPTQLPYTFIARPLSTSQVAIPGVPDGTNLVWNIAEPILANQPLPYWFGPTDNINFVFAVGDALRPGTLYWSAGSNLDSWPQTNQLDVTDPSEALVNGAMSNGIGVLFSIRRAWIIEPNFFNALATVTGTSGSTWTLQATSISRGLFIPRCLAVEGGGNIFFRVDDGIHLSRRGAASISITDESLYPLFVHEGSTPEPVVRKGVTIFPPDDSSPEGQQFSIQNGYLYYDYGYAFGGFVISETSFVPDSGATIGNGIAWQNPVEAVSGPSPSSASITSFSLTSDIVTLQGENDFESGEPVTFGDLDAASFLNGLTLPVLPTGLSDTQFQVFFSRPDIASTPDSGTATAAIPNYASLSVPTEPFAPDVNEYIAYTSPTVASGPSVIGGECFGTPEGASAVAWLTGGALGCNGGCPIGSPRVTSEWSGFQVPTLPAGAVITRIYPVLQVISESAGGADNNFDCGVGETSVFSEILGSGTFIGQLSSPTDADSLGNTDADITGAFISLQIFATGIGPFSASMFASGVMLAVYYTLEGSPPPENQTQTLAVSGGGAGLPPATVVTGVGVSFQTGFTQGSVIVETLQLTVGGSPVGTAKPLNPGMWPQPYSLGGSGDLWGQESMTGAQANELGVNFTASLNQGTQINVNDVVFTIFYESAAHQEGTATLVYDIRAGGWILDQYQTQPRVHAANEGESEQGTLAGCVDGTLRLMESDSPETVTGLVLTPAIGGQGWMTAYELTVEYQASASVTVSFIAADQGNGSYAPNPIMLPATAGQTTKFTTKVSPSKWKLLQAQFASQDPDAQIYLAGTGISVKPWGSDALYIFSSLFGLSGGKGPQG
jgi:hypothetical protein